MDLLDSGEPWKPTGVDSEPAPPGKPLPKSEPLLGDICTVLQVHKTRAFTLFIFARNSFFTKCIQHSERLGTYMLD